MTSNLRFVLPKSVLPPDLPDTLRDIAAGIEAGKVTEFVGAVVVDGKKQFLLPSVWQESTLLIDELQDECLRRGRAEKTSFERKVG